MRAAEPSANRHRGARAVRVNYKNKKFANVVEFATQHMTYEKNRLVNCVEFKQPCKVNLGDDRTIFALGKGTYNLAGIWGMEVPKILLSEKFCVYLI